MRLLLAVIGFMFSFQLYSQEKGDEMLRIAASLHNSNPDSAFVICLEVEKRAELHNEEENVAYAKLGKSRYFLLKNKLEAASHELEAAISLFQKNGNSHGVARCYIAMSNIAGRIKKVDEEIEYLEKANTLFINEKDTFYLLKTLTNLALNYTDANRLGEAEQALVQLEQLTQGMPDKDFYYLNQNWGLFFFKKGEYERALERLIKAREIADELKMIDSQATILVMMGKVKLAQKEYKTAQKLIEKSLEIAQNNQLTMEEFEALEVLCKIHEELGDLSAAYLTFKQLNSVKEKMYDLDMVNKLNAFEREVALAEKQSVIAEQKAELIKNKMNIYILIGILLVVLVSVVFLVVNLRAKKKANEIIQYQKQIVEKKNEEILASITYAKRIQEAILPQDKVVRSYLHNSFVLYKPKDIVSGDFYWMQTIQKSNGREEDSQVLFAAVDCTGHGVPGAFMSIVGNNGLNKAVKELNIVTPSLILDNLNEHVSAILREEGRDVKDGMDIALCSLEFPQNPLEKSIRLEYAGAFNPLYIVRNKGITIIKGDRQSIGEKRGVFQNHCFDLQKDDCIYIFTDGFADQFGGDDNKKLGYNKFRQQLIEISHLPMDVQKLKLVAFFEDWKRDEEQVDDICVIGVRV
jgi:serine phosphatase RsbU (regulator of sigma subunit)